VSPSTFTHGNCLKRPPNDSILRPSVRTVDITISTVCCRTLGFLQYHEQTRSIDILSCVVLWRSPRKSLLSAIRLTYSLVSVDTDTLIDHIREEAECLKKSRTRRGGRRGGCGKECWPTSIMPPHNRHRVQQRSPRLSPRAQPRSRIRIWGCRDLDGRGRGHLRATCRHGWAGPKAGQTQI
jgi:hypothetical protein